MNIPDIHTFIEGHSLLELLVRMKEENIFYFKSKHIDQELLAWGDFKVVNEPTSPPPCTVIMGSFEGETTFYSPANYIFRRDQNYHLSINSSITECPPHLSEVHNIITHRQYSPQQLTWKEQVLKAQTLIKSGAFQKLVLSRDVILEIDNFASSKLIAELLADNQCARDSFFIYSKFTENDQSKEFISFTPELFCKIENNYLQSMSLAGSMPCTLDENQNSENQNILLTNPKLISEHTIVTEEIARRFHEICLETKVSPLQIMQLNYIQHRQQMISGLLKPTTKLPEIIQSLHPTPAVGSMPYHLGIATINGIEERSRNLYAAPIGFSYKEMTEMAVGLRSATIELSLNGNAKVTLHTGCGIVQGSVAEDEWDETENKLRPFNRLLKLQNNFSENKNAESNTVANS